MNGCPCRGVGVTEAEMQSTSAIANGAKYTVVISNFQVTVIAPEILSSEARQQ
jgi:hypothetical protein